MDVTFMEEYYRLRYEDPVSENSLLGEEYYETQKEVYQNIEELENQLQMIAPELLGLINQTLDNISDKYAYLIEKSYLQGALVSDGTLWEVLTAL